MKCMVCKSEVTYKIYSMPRSDPKHWTEMFMCPICFTITPYYEEKRTQEEKDKGMLEYFSEQDWMKTKDELLGLVEFYSSDIDKKNPVGEIGAGPGCLGGALIQSGYDYYGCEPTDLVKRAVESFSIPKDRFLQMDYNRFLDAMGKNKFGTMFIWHVLEHVEDPMDMLKRVYDSLIPGGTLLAQIPIPIPLYVFPDHLTFFTIKTFDYIKKTIGFSKIELSESLEWNFLSIVARKS